MLAFPERGMTLLVTAIIEIPVFLMIVGRDDNVCLVLGKSRYQLFMAFLPISMVRLKCFTVNVKEVN